MAYNDHFFENKRYINTEGATNYGSLSLLKSSVSAITKWRR